MKNSDIMAVRPIVEAIDHGSFDRARSLLSLESLENPVYAGLNALLEFRMGNEREAEEQAAKVCDMKTLSSGVISSILVAILKPKGRADLLNRAFENVYRNGTESDGTLDSWLQSMLELGYLPGLYKCLMVTVRSEPSRQSTYNVAFAMALHHAELPEASPERKLLPLLGERMLQKYLPASDLQEQYVVALVKRMVSTKALIEYCQDSTSLYLQELELEALRSLSDHEYLAKISSVRLQQHDSWNWWLALIDSAMALKKPELVQAVIDGYRPSHNSLLARIELAKRLNEPVEQRVSEFWEKMSSKPAAYELLEGLPTAHLSATNFTAQVTLAKIRKDLKVFDLFKLYREGLPNRPTEPTDYFIGSDLLLLAAETELEAGEESTERALRAVTILTYAHENDRCNFYVLLYLVQLWRWLGAPHMADAYWQQLSVKNLQHESIAWLLLQRAGTTVTGVNGIRKVLQRSLLLAKQATGMGSYLKVALDRGVYTQIPGFLDLARRLRHSLPGALNDLENNKFSQIANKPVDADFQIPDSLVDNREIIGLGKRYLVGPWQTSEYVQLHISGSTFEKVEQSCELTDVEKYCLIGDFSKPPPLMGDRRGWEFDHYYAQLLLAKRAGASFDLPKLSHEPAPPTQSVSEWAASLGLDAEAHSALTVLANARKDAAGELKWLYRA